MCQVLVGGSAQGWVAILCLLILDFLAIDYTFRPLTTR